jgi:hypothetical protein
MTEKSKRDYFSQNPPPQEDEKGEIDFETLKNELQSGGIKIEETEIDGEIPSMEGIDFDLLSGGEKIPTKNFRRNFENLSGFLTEGYYLIDNFKEDHTARKQAQSEILKEIGAKYGEEVQNQVDDIFKHRSKMTNNWLVGFRATIEQTIRYLENNPKYGASRTEKLKDYLEEFGGENDPLNYQGEERLEKVRNLDQVLYKVLLEIKELSDNPNE